MEKKDVLKKELLKRNNLAPNFPSNLVKNRAELLVEMFVQKQSIDLQEYIDAQRIFKINIPTSILKEWYPTPNWKKDVTNMVNQLRKISRFEKGANGSFRYYSLISFSQFTDEDGLQLNSDPESLKAYLIDSKTSYTLLDYELTNKFTCVYSHQFYWLICKHDNAFYGYQLYLRPEEINEMFETHFQNSDIKKYVFTPVKKELERLFEDGDITRKITIEDDWKTIGRKKQIIGWSIKIQNTDRTTRVELSALSALKDIEIVIQNLLPKYRSNIMQQLKVSKAETILSLHQRLQDFDKSDKSHISNIAGYVCKILEAHQIQPHKKIKITAEQISSSSLFDKEEKDIADGLLKWMKCLEYWQTTDLPQEVKDVFLHLRFDSYSQSPDGSKLVVVVPDMTIYNVIEEIHFESLKKTIQQFFPPKTELHYITKK